MVGSVCVLEAEWELDISVMDAGNLFRLESSAQGSSYNEVIPLYFLSCSHRLEKASKERAPFRSEV